MPVLSFYYEQSARAVTFLKRSTCSNHDTSAAEGLEVIAETDKWMLEWAREVLGTTSVALRPPPAGADQHGVSVHLLEVRPDPLERSGMRHRLQAQLRYLVVANGADVAESHEWLECLLIAAMQHPELELETEPVGPELWRAFGIAPQPCLVIRRQGWKELPQKPVKLVRKGVFETVPVMPFAGRVLGPGEIPIVGAQVEYPALNATVRTDDNGRFLFPAAPADGHARKLVISARGRESSVELGPETQLPVTIQIAMED